tara:strand:+ start:1080 stop:1832 length:753 start_codon:yes stop_codon:yes gene_type:complete
MRKYSNRVLDVLDIYDAYIDQKNAENTEDRYKGREHWYGASSSGLCSRKLYYKHVMKAEETNEVQTDSKRLMRLGTIVHDDIQNAINNSINSSLKNTINNDIKYYIEEEIRIEELGVRGFYDLVSVDDQVTLYDFKTTSSYSFKQKFGRSGGNWSENNMMQLGTYGYGVKEQFGRLDAMYLIYYNKDTSKIDYQPVPLTYVNKAYKYWKNIQKSHKKGIPGLVDGISPVYKWECSSKYCRFYDLCQHGIK